MDDGVNVPCNTLDPGLGVFWRLNVLNMSPDCRD